MDVLKYRNLKISQMMRDESTIYSVNPMRIFLGKSQVCNMTRFSGAFERKVYDGNTILFEIDEENNKHKYVYIVGDMVCSFVTSDNIYEYISNMGINLDPYSIATGEENYYLLAPNFKFIKKDMIDNDTILDGNMFQIQIRKSLFKNWNYLKFTPIMIRVFLYINGNNKRFIKFM